jgi:hypothetical protein
MPAGLITAPTDEGGDLFGGAGIAGIVALHPRAEIVDQHPRAFGGRDQAGLAPDAAPTACDNDDAPIQHAHGLLPLCSMAYRSLERGRRCVNGSPASG